MILSYADIVALAEIHGAFNGVYAQTGLTRMPAIAGLNHFFDQYAMIFPNFAALGGLILIASSIILSFFLRANSLAVVFGIALVLIYTAASFLVANNAILLVRTLQNSPTMGATFGTVIANSGLLIEVFLNLPYLMLLFSGVDIVVAVLASRMD